MANQKFDALVYTNDKCVGCNKCISVCPVLTANKAVVENGENKILVDGEHCVSCGACFDACAHDARSYHDDTERFFEDLKYEEIAEITSTNLNTVKSRLHRAIRHLKLEMEVLEDD